MKCISKATVRFVLRPSTGLTMGNARGHPKRMCCGGGSGAERCHQEASVLSGCPFPGIRLEGFWGLYSVLVGRSRPQGFPSTVSAWNRRKGNRDRGNSTPQATFLQPWGLPGWVVVLSPGLVSCVRGPQGAGGCPILSATRNLLRGFEKFYLIRLHAFFDCIFAS